MNNYSGSGRVYLPPKAGKTQTNADYVKFIVEIERPKGKDGKQTFDRINVGCWGSICKYAQYIEQDDIIEFTGPLTTTSYQKDGQWVHIWEISAKTLKIMKKSGTGTQAQPQPAPVPLPPTPPEQIPLPPPPPDDAIPFDIMSGYYG